MAVISSEAVIGWLESFGQLDARAIAALAVVFTVGAFLPMPRTILLLGAGAAFGFEAIVVVVPSTTLGCVLAFLLARSVLRPWIERQTGRKPMWRVLAQAIDDEGWTIAALMRFWGPAPNCVQNYLFGLTHIGLLPYTLITVAFTLPQIAIHIFIGASGRALLLEDGNLPFSPWFIGLAAAVVLIIVFLVSRRIRHILASTAMALPASAGTRRNATS